jgi:hypothetical protein
MLVTLSYVSKACVHDDEAALRDIVAVAESRNTGADVTGALYFDGELFFQVLEGPEAAVQDIFAAIKRDPRHTNVKLLKIEDLPRRRFAGWRMKYTPKSALPPEGPRAIRHALRRPTGAAIDAAIEALR